MGANPTYASFLGIALQPSTSSVAPTAFIPVKSMDPMDKLTLLPDEGWRGAPVKQVGHVPGPLYAEYDFAGDVFADLIGYPLAGLLGDLTVTGASAPYTTALSTLCSGNFQPPKYTLTDWNSNITGYQLNGCQFSELGLKFSGAGKLEYTAKATALSNATTSKPTFSNPPTSIIAGWTGAVTVGGSAITSTFDGEINIKRAVDVIDTVDGTQAPYALWAGELESDGKLTLVMEADTYRANFVAGTSTTIDVNFAAGAGATATQVKLHSSLAFLTDAKVTRGKSYAEIELTYVADGNVTDAGASGGYSPIKATLQNASPSGTYK